MSGTTSFAHSGLRNGGETYKAEGKNFGSDLSEAHTAAREASWQGGKHPVIRCEARTGRQVVFVIYEDGRPTWLN